MKTWPLVVGMGVTVWATLGLSAAGPSRTAGPPVRSSIPYVATRSDTVRDMLWMADVGKDDVVYDLGSGDGRIVLAAVRDFGARHGVGIEIEGEHIRESRQNADKMGVADRVEFIQGDLFTTDFRQASVVTLFLGHEPNIKLRPRLLSELIPGARVVSHQFGMGEWQPDKALTVRTVFLGMWGTWASPFKRNPRVPDYTGNESPSGTDDRIMMWVVPAQVAGVWRGKIDMAGGPEDCELVLHQRLSEVRGTFRLSGQADLTGHVFVDLWGDHVRAWCRPDGMSYGEFEMRFDGHVRENTMKGTLAVADRDQLQEHAWEAQRSKVDLAGEWEWTCATGPRPVRLHIERCEDRLLATYSDRGELIPVPDFYDLGGGFYFTLLIGREEKGLRITEDTGWLIGEGILDRGELKGRIEFHPYGRVPGRSDGEKAAQPLMQDWTPRPIKP